MNICPIRQSVFLSWLALQFLDPSVCSADHIRQLQTTAIENDQSPIAHWGVDPGEYTQWGSHSNRLIPVYTFGTLGAGPGIDLESYIGEHSPYRSETALQEIYGYVPTDTVNPAADWCDQTNIYDIQHAALVAGKKHIILVVFDGMDWETTWAAAIHQSGAVTYHSGRGRGLHFQDYAAGGTTQFGYMATSPHNEGTNVNVDTQTVENPGGTHLGGYDSARGGETPWSTAPVLEYLIGRSNDDRDRHAYTDSSSSASSMTAGIKTYNNAVNVDAGGVPVMTIAHEAQGQGYAVGVVTSVPISHATPAAAYAHNVHRDDYQDLTRDLLGLPSISHSEPLPGMDLVIGAGFGTHKDDDQAQGENFVPGNRYITDADLQAIEVENGGSYIVSLRTAGVAGGPALMAAAQQAAESDSRLFGYYGVGSHLPFQTADGDYQPAPGRSDAETYTAEDVVENPTLAEMTEAALAYMQTRPNGFWLMVESGDVDWANHDNNLDNSIGAVLSGDAAVKTITDWVEANSNWDETVLIVTADHGHYLVIDDPTALVEPPVVAGAQSLHVTCEGTYSHHLQGVCTDQESIYWSFTTTLVKTDLDGRLQSQLPVANHHGDLCFHHGKLYVAVNLGNFNDPEGNADSWVYVYDADTLEELSRHETQQVFHGAGGIDYHDGHFFVVGGLPEDVEVNYVYKYDSDFEFVGRHVIESGHTHLGIQTVTFAHDRWWFGCYGDPQILLVTDADFQLQGRYEFNCSLGIEAWSDGRLLSASGHCDQGVGCSGSVRIAVPDAAAGLTDSEERLSAF